MIKKIITTLSIAVVLSTIFISHSFNDNYVQPSFFGNVFIITLVGIVQMLLFLLPAKQKEYKLALSYTDLSLLAWYIFTVISMILSAVSFNNYQFISFTLLVLFYFFLKQSLKDGLFDSFHITGWILLLAGSFQLLYGSLQFLGLMKVDSLFNVVGTIGNPALYSMYITLLFLWCFGLILFEHPHKILKSAAIVYCAYSFIFIVFLNNRASLIVLLLCLPCLLQIRYGFFSSITRMRLIAKSLLISAGAIIVLSSFLYLYRMRQESSNGRFFIWSRTIEMIKDHPLQGVGFTAYEQSFNMTQARYFKTHPNDSYNAYYADNIGYAFNEFLQITAELGLLGVTAFIGVLMFVIASLYKTKPSKKLSNEMLRASAQIVVLACIIYSFVSYPLRITGSITLFFVFLSMASSNAKTVVTIALNRLFWKSILVCSIILLVLNGIYQKNQEAYYEQWHQASLMAVAGNSNGLTIMAEIYPELEHDKLFLYNYGTELSLAGDYTKGIEVLEKARPELNDCNVYSYLANDYEAIGRFDKAIQYFEIANNTMPSRLYSKYRLYRLYDKTNDSRALSMAQKLIDTPSKGISENAAILKRQAGDYIRNHKHITINR